jgi:hypothetical protein
MHEAPQGNQHREPLSLRTASRILSFASAGSELATNTSIVTEAQIRANLLSMGFTRITILAKDSDRNWHALGNKGDVQIPVEVEPYGISSNVERHSHTAMRIPERHVMQRT